MYAYEVGIWSCVGMFVLTAISRAASLTTNIWLSKWTSDAVLTNQSVLTNTSDYWSTTSYYVGIYAAFGCMHGEYCLSMDFLVDLNKYH